MSTDIFARLLYEGEGDALDFKSAQYPFVGATDEQKAELLKDILAFANSWRRVDAYIVIGAKEIPGSRAAVVGIDSHIDDAQLQQFVNSKVQRPLQFSYTALRVEDKDVALIHIPLQERPFYLERQFGRLAANTVFIRRGSSTAVAFPDEVARMGRVERTDGAIALDVFFADRARRQRLSPSVRSVLLTGVPTGKIPDYETRNQYGPLASLRRTNRDYYRELIAFTVANQLHKPLNLAVRNSGSATAHDVRLEISIPAMLGDVSVLDDADFPSVAQPEYDVVPSRVFSAKRSWDVTAERVEDIWLVQAKAEKVQPEATVWFHDPIFVGASRSLSLECSVSAYADNLPTPHRQVLRIPIEAVSESGTIERIVALEDERITSSPEHQAFLREHGLLDSSGDGR